MATTNFKNTRPVTVNITGAPMALDAYKAVYKRVEELEYAHFQVPQTNITAATSVLTGTTPYKVYQFTVTAAFATGVYTFAFVQEAPNTESLEPVEEEGEGGE